VRDARERLLRRQITGGNVDISRGIGEFHEGN
jgi:hypothetical protein